MIYFVLHLPLQNPVSGLYNWTLRLNSTTDLHKLKWTLQSLKGSKITEKIANKKVSKAVGACNSQSVTYSNLQCSTGR